MTRTQPEPGAGAIVSLDVYLNAGQSGESCVYSGNITHNLGKMARKAGIYEYLWRPDELDPPITKAEQLIEPLSVGRDVLLEHADDFRKLNPENGWGDYEGLLQFTEQYLQACKEWPGANIEISR